LALSLLAAIVYLEVPRITVRPGASDSFVISALRRHQFHLVRRPPESVDNYILSVTTDRDSIWSQCYRNSGIYAQLRRRPASRYHYALDHLFIDSLGSTRAEKLQLLADEFRTNKPKIVLTEDRNPEALPVLADSGLATLLREDYTSTPLRRFGAIVWQRKPNS
jgi:hypothetical protein